ncbi:MAG TPA: ribosomal protein S18-alanine N-acetyltransferase [Gammaproteobacteria bacterium]|nr:ribosomal protein S18-alanine N-acetyltransferase [Gammaproteobacteria bacterium]
MIRPATVQDLDRLVALEQRCFETDRLSRRSFRYMLTKANAALLVDETGDSLCGYVLVLFHAGTSLARMYSIAVAPESRGEGIGAALVRAGEQAALDHGCVEMRLEVRKDNQASIALYRKLGYRQFGVYSDYYEDHADALRFEKLLVARLRADRVSVPYYRQTLDFTCGPASLMMAMKNLDPRMALDRALELRLWRESTTVFMTSGHGGCGPYGLALAAHHRGFDVEVYVNDEGALFIDSVRSDEKKEVIRLVQADFVREIEQAGIPVHYTALNTAELKSEFETGGIPIVLISSYRIYKEKFPHWVVVTGFDDRFIYVHDPYVDEEAGKTETDTINMPILQSDFERMARYGKSGQRAVLVLRRRG